MTRESGAVEGPAARSTAALVAWGFAALLVFAALCGLGAWQVQRLGWKLDLIAKVEARVHAVPAPPPGPAAWPGFDAAAEEYRHVTVLGRFLDGPETLVQAVTERGGGFWVLAPFHTDEGFTVLVNRGFVPPERRDAATRAAGTIQGKTSVTGLLRSTEPGGGFLHSNDPANGRWYSRDVAAIAEARGLGPVAPYFIDADGTPNPGGYPVGGLTVIAFDNNHLVYALTWFGLAALLAAAFAWVVRDVFQTRQSVPPAVREKPVDQGAGSLAP